MADWYRKKPTEIQAMAWTGHNLEELMAWTGDQIKGLADDHHVQLYVHANTAWVNVSVGEWIAKDSHGFYPIKADVFAKSYEPSDGEGIRA